MYEIFEDIVGYESIMVLGSVQNSIREIGVRKDLHLLDCRR